MANSPETWPSQLAQIVDELDNVTVFQDDSSGYFTNRNQGMILRK